MTTRATTTDVLVCGAGPTGLAMAAGLAAHGVRTRIIDKEPARPGTSRALVVQARTLELLQRMGLADELVDRGRTTSRLNVFINARPALDVVIGDIGFDDTPYPYLLFVSQADTEGLLERHLTGLGVQVERPVELLESFHTDADGVTCTLRHGDGGTEQVRAGYLVGCDGAHSAVRHGAGLRFEGAPYEQDFALADAVVDWEVPADRLGLFFRRGGLMAAFPLGGEPPRHRLIILRDPARAAEQDQPTLQEFEERAPGLVPGGRMRLRDPAWVARFRLHHRGVDRYRAGRVFVAGDAAHIHSPVGGQGMNTGIQDAVNLAWKLALVVQGRAPDALLDSYHTERHPVGQVLLRTTDRGFNVATSSNRLVAAARAVVISTLAPRVLEGPGRAYAFRFVSELAINYRRSPIVTQALGAGGERFRGGPRPGDRAPDGPLHTPTGAKGALFEYLRGTAHRLLLFTGPDAGAEVWAAAEGRLRELRGRYPGLLEPGVVTGRGPDRDGDAGHGHTGPEVLGRDDTGLLHRRYGLLGAGVYLVRPDGYVAFRVPGTALEPLGYYLARTFLPG